MTTRYKDKDAGGVVLSFGGQWVSWSHTIVAYRGFMLDPPQWLSIGVVAAVEDVPSTF